MLGRQRRDHGGPLGVEDRQTGEMKNLQALFEKTLQRRPVLLAPVPSLGQLQAHQPPAGPELAFQPLGHRAAHHQGLVQGSLHLPVPGVVHPAGNQLPGHEEEEEGGHQGQGDEGQNQPGPEVGAENFAPALEKKLGEVPEYEKGKEQEEEGVEIEEAEGQEAAGHRLAAPVHQVDFQGGDGHHQDQRYGDEDAFPAAFGRLRGRGLPGGRALTEHQRLFSVISR